MRVINHFYVTQSSQLSLSSVMVRKEKKSLPLYCQSLQYCTAPLQIWLTNCKTQPGCADKLQNSARLLRQTAKLSPVAQTNCKTQPGCSDKLQNSARLLRQTAKLSPVAQTNCKTQPGCMGDVNAVSCHVMFLTL